MTRALPDEDGALAVAAVEPALEAAERADALVLGPGLGRADGRSALRARAGAPASSCRWCSTPTASTRTPARPEALAQRRGARPC